MNAPFELVVVMPVYNEQDSIRSVIVRWSEELSSLGINYCIRAYNDGSKDDTGERLDVLKPNFPNLEVFHKANSGHGPTILGGYKMATDCQWIFQIDSDDEMGPDQFSELWRQRHDFDFLIGFRDNRESPWSRRVVSSVSRLAVKWLYGDGVIDVNSPYRLMRKDCFEKLVSSLPGDTFAPNVIVSGYACYKKLRVLEIPVEHQPRQAGEVSIKRWRLFKAALKSFWQTAVFRFRNLKSVANNN